MAITPPRQIIKRPLDGVNDRELQEKWWNSI
jgi:hypothetical protein